MAFVQSAFLSTYFRSREFEHQRFMAKARRIASTPLGQKVMNSPEMESYIVDRLMKLGQGVELRRQQEHDSTKGERVWFSRSILNGRLQHWVLITHGKKYELRRADHVNSEHEKHTKERKREQYVCNIKEYTIDEELRDASLASVMIPEVDGYYVCLIGWTRYSSEEVDAIAHNVRSKFGEYSLLRNNCQKFLRQLAEEILIETKAADYPWFASNTKTRYQKDQWLKPPPEEMMMRMLAKIQEAKNGWQNAGNMGTHQMLTALPKQIDSEGWMQLGNMLVNLVESGNWSGNGDGGVGGYGDVGGDDGHGYESHGHDHGHESHGHGHSHGHSYDHGHDHGYGHSHGHSHGGYSHDHGGYNHSHDHGGYSHSHDHGGYSHSHGGHSHDHGGHSHDHGGGGGASGGGGGGGSGGGGGGS